MKPKELDIAPLEKTWDDYLHDDNYTNFGKLNLVAWLGERTGPMLAEIKRLRAELEKIHEQEEIGRAHV